MNSNHPHILSTQRLTLRPWCQEDVASLANLHADPRVMEYFPRTLTQAESDKIAEDMIKSVHEQGGRFWAVSITDQNRFIGFVALMYVDFSALFTPAVKISWKFAYDFWNQGYATESAKAAIQHGFENLHIDEIVAFTTVMNSRSRRVMEKIGMFHDKAQDFDHPKLPIDHVLRRHALYRIQTGHFTQIGASKPAHFQASIEVAACYVELGDKMLLLKRAAHCPEGNTWTAPAGKMDAGETSHQAAVRELMEETGIQALHSTVKEVGKLYVQKPAKMYILHLFQVQLKEMPQITLSPESTEYVWATHEEIQQLPLIGGGHASFIHYARMKAKQ